MPKPNAHTRNIASKLAKSQALNEQLKKHVQTLKDLVVEQSAELGKMEISHNKALALLQDKLDKQMSVVIELQRRLLEHTAIPARCTTAKYKQESLNNWEAVGVPATPPMGED